jgi:hypothetical protein
MLERAPATVVLVLALGLTACGSTTQTKTHTDSTKAQTTSSTSTTAGPTSSVTTGPVHATFTAPNHAPKAGVLWPYSVRVTDASGQPLSGTVAIEFTYAGSVVGHDTPPVHPVKDGHWQDKLTYPADAVGQPLTVQAVIHTTQGSVTLNWPIKVQR